MPKEWFVRKKLSLIHRCYKKLLQKLLDSLKYILPAREITVSILCMMHDDLEDEFNLDAEVPDEEADEGEEPDAM